MNKQVVVFTADPESVTGVVSQFFTDVELLTQDINGIETSLKEFGSSSIHGVFIDKNITELDVSTLNQLAKALAPTGSCAFKADSTVEAADVQKRLTLAGFVDTSVQAGFCITRKPAYDIGAAAPLRLKKRAAPTENGSSQSAKPATSSSNSNSNSVWMFDDDDLAEDDLVDADTIETDLNIPKPYCIDEQNKPKTRKPCANCTCGLVEEQQQLETISPVKSQPVAEVKSSCGSCYLGDAYRCPTCPHLGMPAFQPGDKVQLPDRMLTNDL